MGLPASRQITETPHLLAVIAHDLLDLGGLEHMPPLPCFSLPEESIGLFGTPPNAFRRSYRRSPMRRPGCAVGFTYNPALLPWTCSAQFRYGQANKSDNFYRQGLFSVPSFCPSPGPSPSPASILRGSSKSRGTAPLFMHRPDPRRRAARRSVGSIRLVCFAVVCFAVVCGWRLRRCVHFSMDPIDLSCTLSRYCAAPQSASE